MALRHAQSSLGVTSEQQEINKCHAGLALDTVLCSPFWRLCDDFKSPRIKSISQMEITKTFQIDLCPIFLKILNFFKVQSCNIPKCISAL